MKEGDTLLFGVVTCRIIAHQTLVSRSEPSSLLAPVFDTLVTALLPAVNAHTPLSCLLKLKDEASVRR